jgi:hypothetical protein
MTQPNPQATAAATRLEGANTALRGHQYDCVDLGLQPDGLLVFIARPRPLLDKFFSSSVSPLGAWGA